MLTRLCLVGFVCTLMPSAHADDATQKTVTAVNALFESLNDVQREQIAFPFSGEERMNWHFIPRARKGLPLKDMTDTQKALAFNVLNAALSAEGFDKVEDIRALELVLQELGGSPAVRDPERYYFAVFGAPSIDGTWGLRYEGHHLSLNWTFVEGKGIAWAPQFLGANPAEVPSGSKKGERALAAEEDLARSLLESLSEPQRDSAVISTNVPRDIFTGADRVAEPLEDEGIAYKDMTESQQGALISLIEQVAGLQAPEWAKQRLAAIRNAGLNSIKFAWIGSPNRGEPHYYRVQGPTFLIEYDNIQNDANHIHLVWRDFNRDFGRDLLREHYQAHAHPHH